MRKLAMCMALLGLLACEEAPLFSEDFEGNLNAPSTFVLFPSTQLALMVNTNIVIREPSSSFIIYDLNTQSIDESSRFPTANFTVRPLIDESRERIVVADLDRFLRFWTYQIPGDNEASVSFEEETVDPATSPDLTNAIEMDDVPSDVVLVDSDLHGELYLILNQLGTVTVVEADTLEKWNLNEEDRYEGKRIVSAFNIDEDNAYPARGVTRFFQDPMTEILYMTNPNSNFIYLLDPHDIGNEGVVSLQDIAGNTSGVRSIAFDNSGRGYLLHQGLQSVLVFDASLVFDNGVDFEVIEPMILQTIPLYGVPNELVFNAAQDRAFVSIQDYNEIVSIDLDTLSLHNRTTLSEGRGPSTLYFDQANNAVMSLDFFSDNITRLDATSLNEIEVIE